MSPDNYTYNESGFIVIYGSVMGNINHTSMVFSRNTGIYNYLLMSNPDVNYTFEMTLNLDNYPYYYSNNLHYGNFSYDNETTYFNYTSDYITLYEAGESLSMFFDSNSSFNFSSYNSTLHLQIAIPVTGTYGYRFIFHPGNFTQASSDEYTVRFGIYEEIEGIRSDNLTANYSDLKNKWNFPSSREFDIRMYENSTANSYMNALPDHEIGIVNSRNRNIHAKSDDLFELDSEGQLTPLYINYRIS